MSEPELIRCVSCGATNRVSREKLADHRAVVCGRCKTPLPIPGRPIVVTDATFASVVEQSPLPVLLDLWAPWCGPCRMVAPIVEELAADTANRLRVGKLNVDESPRTAERFQVRSIPTLLILKNGREIDRVVGAVPKSELEGRLRQVLAQPAT